MTFTFTDDLTIPVNFVRFYSSDTVQAEAFLSDELITSLITDAGSKQKAVIAAIEYKIARLSQPNFKADWLQVDNKSAVDSLLKMLAARRAQFGVPAVTASVMHVYRADSAATEEPDFTDGRP